MFASQHARRGTAILGLAAGAPQPARALVLTEADAGKEIKLDVGQPLQIELPAHHGTPYRWRIEPEQGGLGQPTGVKYESSTPTAARPGARGKTVFTWRSICPDLRPGSVCGLSFTYGHVGDPTDCANRVSFKLRIVPKPEVFTAAAADEQVDIPKGTDFIIRLPANQATPYRWSVHSQSRSLGAPTITYVPTPSRPGDVGVGGNTEFRFTTDGMLTQVGDVHGIALAHTRLGPAQPGGVPPQPVQVLRFKVRVVEASASAPPPVAHGNTPAK